MCSKLSEIMDGNSSLGTQRDCEKRLAWAGTSLLLGMLPDGDTQPLAEGVAPKTLWVSLLCPSGEFRTSKTCCRKTEVPTANTQNLPHTLRAVDLHCLGCPFKGHGWVLGMLQGSNRISIFVVHHFEDSEQPCNDSRTPVDKNKHTH